MLKVDTKLQEKLCLAPNQEVSLIVRTNGDPTPHLTRFNELGLNIRHKYRLLPGVSVTGQASAALALLNEAWIVRIEEDRTVATS